MIKSDLFNQFPGEIGPRIFGVVEIPDFVDFLTSAKTDFMRGGRHRELEKMYGPVREEFKQWLHGLGVLQLETSSTDEGLRLEKELRKLIDYVPELGEFFGFRMPKEIIRPNANGDTTAEMQDGLQTAFPVGNGQAGKGDGLLDSGDEPGQALVEDKLKGQTPATPITRSSKHGPKVAFVDAPTRQDMAWIEGNNVVINIGHPAYIKVCTNNVAKRLYYLFSIADAIQRFMNDTERQDLMFTDRMMAAWGNS